MEANELRIGNYIQFGGNFCKVSELQDGCFYVKHHSGFSMKNTSYELKPIPLTEEVLLKCGFEKSSLGYFTIFCGSNVMSVYCFDEFSRVKIVSQTICCVNYLHQLQNLYFALTGKELQLN